MASRYKSEIPERKGDVFRIVFEDERTFQRRTCKGREWMW